MGGVNFFYGFPQLRAMSFVVDGVRVLRPVSCLFLGGVVDYQIIKLSDLLLDFWGNGD